MLVLAYMNNAIYLSDVCQVKHGLCKSDYSVDNILNPPNTSHIWPSQVSSQVFIVSILKKMNCISNKLLCMSTKKYGKSIRFIGSFVNVSDIYSHLLVSLNSGIAQDFLSPWSYGPHGWCYF